MKLEQQVTSLEISKKLKELWVKQDSLFYYAIDLLSIESSQIIQWDCPDDCWWWSFCSAFTASELWELLPLFEVRKKWPDYYRSYSNLVWMNDYFMSDEESMVESMGKTLIYLLENKLMTLTQ